jgi:O-antigen/teichoic acid export membrane protein
MEKAVDMGKTSVKGSFQLFIGRIVSTLVLAVGTIVVGMYISDVEYGLYTIALVPAATFLLFQDWGVGTALTKYCANYRAEKKEAELRTIIVSGLTFQVLTGIALTLLSFLTASFVASTILGNSESAFLVALASITIFFTAIYGGSLSVFVGFERMGLSTVSLIVSSAVQGLLSPLLVYLGFGAIGAVAGFTVASVASGVTGVFLLYFSIFRKLPSAKVNKAKLSQTLKPLLRYGIPISIATIISGISTQIYYFLMASYADLAMIGNYRIATNFALFLTFFIFPIQTVLFPAFSKLNPSKDRSLLTTVFASSIKYSSLFLVPATIALMVLSNPMIATIYGDKWLTAPFFLTLSVVGNVLVLLGNISVNRLLYAMGETKMLMKLNTLTLCIGVPLAFLLIPPLGVLGVIIVSSLVAGVPSMSIGIYWTWRRYETKPDLRNSARIFLASVVAGFITYLFLNSFTAAAWIMLAGGAILFLTVYLISIPLFGAVSQVDIANLRIMFSGLGPIAIFLNIPLALVEKPLKFKNRDASISEQK